MASINQVVVELLAETRQFQAGLRRAATDLKAAAGQMEKGAGTAAAGMDKAGKSAQGFFGRLGEGTKRMLFMGVTFVAFYRGLVLVNAAFDSMAGGLVNFDKNMRNVQSITKQTDASLNRMSKRVIELVTSGRSAGQSAVVLSDALYDIVSSGFEGEAALKVLEVAAQGAAAGLSDAKTSAKALMAILNAYKLPVSEADNVMSVLFRTVDKGIITFEELTSTLGLVVSSAATLDVGITDLGAAITVLTRQGQQPSRVMTNLNAVLTAMIKPSKQARETAEGLGIDLSAAAVKSKGFLAVLTEIAQKAGNNTEALGKMFPEVRALRAIFPLVARGGAEFTAMLKLMEAELVNATATQAALERQQKSLAFQMQLLGSRIQASFIKGMRPAITWLAQQLPRVSAMFEFMFKQIGAGFRVFAMMPSWAKGLLALAVAVGVLTVAVWALSVALTALSKTSVIFQVITWGALALTAAIGGLGFAFNKLKFEAEDAKRVMREWGTEQAGLFSGITDLPPAVEETGEAAGGAAAEWEGLKDTFEETTAVAESTLITLERLAKQFPAVGAALSVFGTARDSLKELSLALAAAKNAVEAHNKALIKQALASLSALAPAAYDKAQGAIESLTDIHAGLTEQLGREQRVLADLEDEYNEQTRVVDRYERQLKGLETQLSRAEDAMRDLLNAPIVGEEEFDRALFAIDQRIAQLQLTLSRTAGGPGGEEQRRAIEREIADLERQREQTRLERQIEIGPTEFEREMLGRRAEGPEVAGADILSGMQAQLAIIKELTPQVASLERVLLGEKETLEGLEGPLGRQRELVEDLGSAISEIESVMDSFKTSLQGMVDFAVARLQELVTGGAGGAGAATGEEFVEGWLPSPEEIEANLRGWATETAARAKKAIEEEGRITPEIAGRMRLEAIVPQAMAAFRQLIAAGVPAEEAARIVREEYVAGMEEEFGTLPPEISRIVSGALTAGIKAAPLAPETSEAVYDTARQLTALTSEALAAGQEDLADKYTDDLVYFLAVAAEDFKPETFDFLSAAVASNLLTPEQLSMALLAAGVPEETVNSILRLLEDENEKDYVAERLRQMGSGDVDKIGEGLQIRAEEKEWDSFWDVFFKAFSDPKAWAEKAGEAMGSLATGIWDAFWGALTYAFDKLFDPGKIWELIKKGMGKVKDFFGDWEILPGLKVRDIVSGFGKAGEVAGGAVSKGKGLLEKGLGFLGGQHGFRNFMGGMAMVGEGGRELALFPRGTSLASGRDTAKILDQLARGQKGGGINFAPTFDISVVGDRWEEMQTRLLRLVEQRLDQAAAEAGIASPLTTHGVGIRRI